MKLIYATVFALAASAVLAGPRRNYNRRPNANQAQASSNVNLDTDVDSVDDLKNYAESFYNKHGAQYQRQLQALSVKLQNGFKKGANLQQKQANIENILKKNAPSFGMTYNQANNLINTNRNEIKNLLSSINISEIKSTANGDLGGALDQGIDAIENQDLKSAVEDLKDLAVDSLDLDEDKSVQENLFAIFEALDEKFDIMDQVEEAVDDAKNAMNQN